MLDTQRRQSERHDINLTSSMSVDGAHFVECMIRDISKGGLFIDVPHNGVGALSLQQQLLLHFSVDLDQDERDFSLDVKIAHIDGKGFGFGVAFSGNADLFFKALSKSSQPKNNVSSEKSLTLQKLDTEFSSLSQEVFPLIMDGFFKKAENTIEQAVKTSEDYHTHVTLLDTFTNLKINKIKILNSFCNSNLQDIQLKPSSILEQSSKKVSDESILSLVEKDDFEDWLNLLPIIRNLEGVFQPQLTASQEKIAFILRLEADQVANPFSPKYLCERFRDILSKIEDSEQGKNWLYDIYGDILSEHLPPTYKKLDSILFKYQKQETAERKKKKLSIKSGFPEEKLSSSAALPSQPTLSPQVVENSHLGSSQLSSNHPDNKEILNIASHLIHLTQGQSVQPSNDIVENIEAYSGDEICSALSFLQQNIIDNKSHKQVNYQKFQSKLRQALSHFSPAQKHLSVVDKKSLDICDRLIRTLFNDTLLSEQAQSYLQQIYIPILVQAIKNPSLLESGSHPVRDIINHLSKLDLALKDPKVVKDIDIKKLLDLEIKKISHNSINNLAVFHSVEKKLRDLVLAVEKSISLNVKRVNDVYEGKQKLQEAQQFVQNDINQQLGRKKIPKIVITLLEAGWQHLLVIAQLNADKKGYQTHFLTINNLIAWLTRKKPISKELAISTLEFIDKELQPVNSNRLLHSIIQSELQDLLLDDNVGLTVMEMASIDIEKNQPESTFVNNLINEVESLNVGEWLSFSSEQEDESLKLAWINKDYDLFVFVNRGGLKKLELKSEELANKFKRGEASRIESLDTPIMDRATHLMMQNLHEKLIFNATHDPVTQLLNQKEFIKQLRQELTRLNNAKYLLCHIEIQDFRSITNACGIAGIEALLKQLSSLLKQRVKEGDLCALINDRTFSVLLKNCSAQVAKELHTKFINSEFKWQDKNFAVAVSMGIVPLFSDINYEINRILQNVDSANLSALNAGRSIIRVYKEDDASLQSQFDEREWVGRINQVLAEDRLFLRCQKIVAINHEADRPAHYEILLGIKDNKGNTILPGNFIPAVERCQRMSEVDRWVVLSVFDWIRNNQQAFASLDGFSINLSGESISSEDFLKFLNHTLSTCDIPLEKITFEITETVAANNFQFVQKFIKEIKLFKCKFSLDDFGSGYSSFSYLKRLKVDYLKIDGIFVKDILNSSTDAAIVSSMNEIAHFLRLETTAEYVENNEIHDLLKEIGVDYAQGWGIEKPKLLTDLS